MMYLSQQLIDKWSQLPLFKRNSLTISNVKIEHSLDKVIKKIQRLQWENYLLDQRNEVTVYLFKHHRDMYNGLWNNIAIEVRQILMPIFESNIGEAATEYLSMKDCILYCLVNLCIYREYNIRGCVTSEFFDEMERIFESGYVPFGYEGKFPNGTWNIY